MGKKELNRGFAFDELTEADDESVIKVRDRLFACPCGMGAWVSVQNGRIYRGHGGNEREQVWLKEQGPWVLMDEGTDTRLKLAEAVSEEWYKKWAKLSGSIGDALYEHG